ncbi:MAG: NAD(P)-dependent oxidoreductase [Planctomycetes bacterium]|nr:NAD(P)-dependent oxidoreductase [Planctomycetota bacterium]
MDAPDRIEDAEMLEEVLSRPSPEVGEALARAPGDILILGVGGKMGPTLARMARRALDAAGDRRRVIAVSRFSRGELRAQLESLGIETIPCDLMARGALDALPDAPNVIYMVGRKFGSTGGESLTWATNAFLPGSAAQRFAGARILAFSTGNVYPLTRVDSGGPCEDHPLGPIGEYAESCLGRERVLEFFSRENGTAVAIIRLNYAIDLRYGVLADVAAKVFRREAIDLAMGFANVIWQGDANAQSLRALPLAATPPFAINVTGPEIISIRDVARRFGERFGIEPVLRGEEAETALLSDASRARALFGPPRIDLDTMIGWVADWIARGGESYGKPTHFEVRDGKF